MMTARLQRYISGRGTSQFAGLLQRNDLGVVELIVEMRALGRPPRRPAPARTPPADSETPAPPTPAPVPAPAACNARQAPADRPATPHYHFPRLPSTTASTSPSTPQTPRCRTAEYLPSSRPRQQTSPAAPARSQLPARFRPSPSHPAWSTRSPSLAPPR